MQTSTSFWERALAQLMPLTGRLLSIEIAATDGWVVASFGGTLEKVDVVTMGGAGGEDARLHIGGPLPNRLYLSENDLVAMEVVGELVAFTTRDVVIQLAVL